MDQRAVQNILAKAIKRMRLVYKTKDEALMQQDPNPPVQFQPYKQNAGALPVIGLMEQIDERTKAKAAAEVEKAETEASKDSTETQLESLAEAAADLHKQCDFVLKNFDIRQKARLQEIEALQGAKALLSGMQDDN